MKIPLALLVTFLSITAPLLVRADFTDSYIITDGGTGIVTRNPGGTYGTWDFVVTGDYSAFAAQNFDTTQAPSSIVMDPGPPVPNGPGYSLQYTLSNTAVAGGGFSFDYVFSRPSNNLSCQAAYFVNGVYTYLPADTGSVANIALSQGDTFGFYVQGGPKSVTNGINSFADLTVSNFSVSAVPEPSSWILIGLAAFSFFIFPRLTRRWSEHSGPATSAAGAHAAPHTIHR